MGVAPFHRSTFYTPPYSRHNFSSMTGPDLQKPVEFAKLPKLLAPLAAHPVFQFLLHDKASSIDAEICAADSKKRKLKFITQTAGVHLTCLKLEKAIVVAEDKNEQSEKVWTKTMVNILDRAQGVNPSFRFIRALALPSAPLRNGH